MRNKEIVQARLERIELLTKSLNFHIGRMERRESYEVLDDITETLEYVRTLLNTETQQ